MIVPSIDVRGQQLSDGPVASVLERVRKLVAEGAEELHLVDLDAAEGASRNLELMAEIARFKAATGPLPTPAHRAVVEDLSGWKYEQLWGKGRT